MQTNFYYKQKQFIEKVNLKGNHLGYIEKWDAHKNGVLHRGFTVILIYKGYYVIQHRKHPAFDGVFDLTFSSHQVLIKNKLQNSIKAASDALKREFNISIKDLISEPKKLGSLYYKAKDSKSIYTEHEIDEILIAKIKKIPNPNLEFAYGFSLVTKNEILNKKGRIYEDLSPWAKKIIEKKIIK